MSRSEHWNCALVTSLGVDEALYSANIVTIGSSCSRSIKGIARMRPREMERLGMKKPSSFPSFVHDPSEPASFP